MSAVRQGSSHGRQTMQGQVQNTLHRKTTPVVPTTATDAQEPPSQPNAGGPNSGLGQRPGPDNDPSPAQRHAATPPSLRDREGTLYPVPDPGLSKKVAMAIEGTRHSR
ncbi:hypothetical protein HPB51_003001 [Rhipicephalus microplus]|uniref:Uncharacterized protein n=1 Tax=Rhipicephalus microplus TaxID=6941 RepID=A0A9J6DS91_RHIMP|nr:hypothetical protein HPB51_003001 [Rhipicephalus microplus]